MADLTESLKNGRFAIKMTDLLEEFLIRRMVELQTDCQTGVPLRLE
jgi:hypothetical protein